MAEEAKYPPIICGLFGLWILWTVPYGGGEASVFPSLLEHPDVLAQCRYAMLVCYIIGCLIAAFFLDKLGYLRDNRWLIVGCAAVSSAGLIVPALVTFGAPMVCLPIGAGLRGLVSCIFGLAWVESLLPYKARKAAIAIGEALVVYAVAGLLLNIIGRFSIPAAEILLALMPFVCAAGCLYMDKHVEIVPRSAEEGMPITQTKYIGYLLANLVIGFFFGIIMAHMIVINGVILFGSAIVIGLVVVVAFMMVGREVDLGYGYRYFAMPAALALFLVALLHESFPLIVPILVACIWTLVIFFAHIIYSDVGYSMPGKGRSVAGISLSIFGTGLLLAAIAFPPAWVMENNQSVLVAATFTTVMLLMAFFSPNGRSWVPSWGFSTFSEPESRDAFILRRCTEVGEEIGLTKREFEIAQLLVAGYKKDVISEMLVISPLTTKTHIRNIYLKADVHSQSDFARLVFGEELSVPADLLEDDA